LILFLLFILIIILNFLKSIFFIKLLILLKFNIVYLFIHTYLSIHKYIDMRTTKRYLRGLKKNKKTRKNRRIIRKVGGHIDSSKIFENILSIGFEMEATDLIKFTLTKDEMTDNFILVNSALTNVDLEYGFTDPDEYTYTKETKDETFKITNDSLEHSKFNKLVEELYYGHDDEDINEEEYQVGGEEEYEDDEEEDDEDEDDKNIILKIPPNQYLSQTDYTVKFREPSSELLNFSSFTDTEFIATYYNPIKSTNIIKECLFKSVRELSEHLNKLVTINNSKMMIKNDDNETEIPNLLNQSYVLPNTSLVYFNSSLDNIQNYNIREDLNLVIQMTFSCNIMYCYRIMKQLLSIQNIDNYEKQLNNYSNTNKSVRVLLKAIYNIKNNLNYDEYAITTSMNIVNDLFSNYNQLNKTYPLNNDTDTTKMIKSYMFLIIYKVFIYLNPYIENIDQPGNMLKRWLTFAVRHYNYALFLELKNLINNVFFVNKTNSDGENASTIIQQLLDDKILNRMYDTPVIKNKRSKLNIDVKNDVNLQSKYYGDPLFSIKSYFHYFDKFNDDWLVTNNIDEKSTKFDLKNNVIIIEFRTFPLYTYLEFFSMADDKVKNEILQNKVGSLNMRVLNHFISK